MQSVLGEAISIMVCPKAALPAAMSIGACSTVMAKLTMNPLRTSLRALTSRARCCSHPALVKTG